LERYISYLKDIRENVFSRNGFQQYLREKYIPLIQRYTNEIFKEFELPYSHIQIKNDYDIIVDNLPVKTLSGGEQIAVSLALRLGIAKAVCNNLQCIILDEPTAFLDEDRRKKLLNIFGNIKTISQIFVISHHDELEQVANNIINIKKIGEDSVITSS
jgi:exonuclease SbcC